MNRIRFHIPWQVSLSLFLAGCGFERHYAEVSDIGVRLEHVQLNDITGAAVEANVVTVFFEYPAHSSRGQRYFKKQKITELKIYIQDTSQGTGFRLMKEDEFRPFFDRRLAQQDFRREIHPLIPEPCGFNYVREIEKKYFDGLMSFNELRESSVALCGLGADSAFRGNVKLRYADAHLFDGSKIEFAGFPGFLEDCLERGFFAMGEKLPLPDFTFAIDDRVRGFTGMKVVVALDGNELSETLDVNFPP